MIAFSLGPPPVASVRMLSKLTDRAPPSKICSIKFACAGHGHASRFIFHQRFSAVHITRKMYWTIPVLTGESRKGGDSAPSFQSKPYKAGLGPNLHKASGFKPTAALLCTAVWNLVEYQTLRQVFPAKRLSLTSEFCSGKLKKFFRLPFYCLFRRTWVWHSDIFTFKIVQVQKN